MAGLISVAGLGLNTGCNRTKNDGERSTVRIAYLPLVGALPLFVAIEQGFFEKRGLQIEPIQFNTSNELAIAATTGRVDAIGIGATNAVLDAATTSGKNLRAFATVEYVKPKLGAKSTDALVVQKGIRIEDLAGKRIAFFPGSVSRVFASMIFPTLGVQFSDIEYIEMPPGGWMAAMDSGAIDGFHAVEPFVQMVRNSDQFDIILDGYLATAMPNVPLSASWFVEGALSTDLELSVFEAFAEAIAFINNQRQQALGAFALFSQMPPELYTEIGLNEWRLLDNEKTRNDFTAFVELLEMKDAIKQTRSAYIWNG